VDSAPAADASLLLENQQGNTDCQNRCHGGYQWFVHLLQVV